MTLSTKATPWRGVSGEIIFNYQPQWTKIMKFIEMTGATLREALHPDEIEDQNLHAEHVEDDSILRINQQGDIEIRRSSGWDVIGGLLGEFQERIKHASGLDWA